MIDMTTNREAWQNLANDLAPQRPSVGKSVRVTEGRKHLGKVGKVTWHGVNKFDDLWRYQSEAQMHYRDMAGRDGYRVGIETPDGKSFFINADKVEVINQ